MKKALVFGKKEDTESISNLLREIGFTAIEIGSVKQAYKSIPTIKPQVLLFPVGTNVKQIAESYPFIPIIYYESPPDETNLINKINQITKEYLSDEIFWDKQFLITKEKKKEKRKKTLLFYLLICGIVIVFDIYVRRERILKFGIKSFDLPYSNPCVFATLNEKSILLCSRNTSSIYEHDIQDLKIKRIYSFPECRFNSIVSAGGYIYSCDLRNKSIHKHKPSGEFDIVKTYTPPIPVESISSMSYDGNFFWMLNSSTGEVYKVALGDDFQIVAKYNLPGFTSITSDDKYLYGLTQKTNLIYRYKLPELKLDKIFSLPEVDDVFDSFIITEKNIWLCSQKESKVYKVSRKLLK